MGRLEPVTCVSFLGVQMNEFLSTAAFLRLRPLPFVGQKILERGEQESTELSALPIGLGQSVLLLEVHAKSLDEVLGVGLTIAAPADISVKGIPVGLEKIRQRLLGA